MGWNTSLIIIQNKQHFSNEVLLLQTLGFAHFEQKETATFDAILNPKDDHIGIGYYNGNLIICDGYLLTSKSLEESENLDLVAYEKNLVALFPQSEIVTISCVSSVNFHGYSLIENGVKKRLKYAAVETKQEFGERFEEENDIYKDAYQEDGVLRWKDADDADDFYTEDQLMEDFTFKVAKRRLGVEINTEEADALFDETEFKVFQIKGLKNTKTSAPEERKTSGFKWKKYLILAVLFVLVRMLLRIILK